MGHLRPRQGARIGMVYLEEAILAVLFEATKKGEGKELSAIGKELDIPPRRVQGVNRNEIPRAVVDRLERQGRVKPCSDDNKKWQLTEEEFRGWD